MSQIKKKLRKAYYVYIINDQKAELAKSWIITNGHEKYIPP